MLPCRLLSQTGRVRLPATGHRLYPLLTMAPNGYMTSQEFWELLVACLCLRGNFFAYKVMALAMWLSCCRSTRTWWCRNSMTTGRFSTPLASGQAPGS
ncbi:phage portal protein [Pseudomonas sp. PCH446]